MMKGQPKISIITPSYNQGQYIEQTITSIVNQEYPNLELIIIDGGSTDNTVEVIRKYEKYIAYWVSEKDNGQAHAINKGLEVATGDIFNWINSDDILEPGSLIEIADFFTRHKDKNVLCGYTRCFFDGSNETSHIYRMNVYNTVHKTILNVGMNQPGTFYRMGTIKSLKGVNDSLRYVFDDELWFRYLCSHGLQKIGFTKKTLAQFRLHNRSKTVAEGFDNFLLEKNQIYYYLAQRLFFPDYLLEQMKYEKSGHNYISLYNWNFNHLNKKAFQAFFSAKYLNKIYLEKTLADTKEALRLAIRHNYFQLNRKFLSIGFKVAFLNANN